MAGISKQNNPLLKKRKRTQPLISTLLLNRDISRSALLQQEDLDVCVASMELLVFKSLHLLTQVSGYPRKHILELWHRVVSGSIGNRLLYRGTPLIIPDPEDLDEIIFKNGDVEILEDQKEEDDEDDGLVDDDEADEEEDDEEKPTPVKSSEAWKKVAEERFMTYGAVLLKASLLKQDTDDFIRLLRSLNLSREMYTQVITDALHLAEDDQYGDYCGLVDRASILNSKISLSDSEINESIYINRRMYEIETNLEADPLLLYGVLKTIKTYFEQHQVVADMISTAYLRLVVKNAQQRKVAGESQSPDDDRQNGVFGLLRAIGMYDHRTGARFATYAGYWIRQAIRFHAKLQINMIRQPKSLWDSYNRVEKTRRTLVKSNPEKGEISYKELAKSAGLSVKQVEKIYTRVKTSQVRSLDFSMEGGETETFTLKDVTPLEEEDEVMSEKVIARISQLLQRLPEEESLVVALRFGLLDHLAGEEMDLESIAKERIRQLVAADLTQQL